MLTDVPIEGLAAASRRATSDGVERQAWGVVARGQMLPLRPATFDAVVHTDVLCCLRAKLATLRAVHRYLSDMRPVGNPHAACDRGRPA